MRSSPGYFDWLKKDYTRIPIEEQVEVLALVGDITLNDEPKLHTHVVVSKADGTAHGGHLLEAHVRPTLEVIITESPYSPAPPLGSGDGPRAHPVVGTRRWWIRSAVDAGAVGTPRAGGYGDL